MNPPRKSERVVIARLPWKADIFFKPIAPKAPERDASRKDAAPKPARPLPAPGA